MHSTSPGLQKVFDIEKSGSHSHEIAVRQGQKCIIGKSKTENLISEIVGGVNTIKSDETHTYDDPYELTDEWTSPIHIPRSKSWLCCPNTAQEKIILKETDGCIGGIQPEEFHKRCEYSYLVTEAPRPQCPNVNINFYLCWN
jgi:hypothetical protein